MTGGLKMGVNVAATYPSHRGVASPDCPGGKVGELPVAR